MHEAPKHSSGAPLLHSQRAAFCSEDDISTAFGWSTQNGLIMMCVAFHEHLFWDTMIFPSGRSEWAVGAVPFSGASLGFDPDMDSTCSVSSD